MRAPTPGIDYDMFNEGWMGDCAYCDAQFASPRRREAEAEIKAHIRGEHSGFLEPQHEGEIEAEIEADFAKHGIAITPPDLKGYGSAGPNYNGL